MRAVLRSYELHEHVHPSHNLGVISSYKHGLIPLHRGKTAFWFLTSTLQVYTYRWTSSVVSLEHHIVEIKT